VGGGELVPAVAAEGEVAGLAGEVVALLGPPEDEVAEEAGLEVLGVEERHGRVVAHLAELFARGLRVALSAVEAEDELAARTGKHGLVLNRRVLKRTERAVHALSAQLLFQLLHSELDSLPRLHRHHLQVQPFFAAWVRALHEGQHL